MGIRSVDGNETSGLVEVLRNCEWRSVCDDYWTDEDAKVASGQLGFLPYGMLGMYILLHLYNNHMSSQIQHVM